MAAKLITRTIFNTHVVGTATIQIDGDLQLRKVEADVSGIYTDLAGRKALKKAISDVDPSAIKAVLVTDSHTSEQVYAISEDDFIRYGHPIERPLSQKKHTTEEG